MEEMPNLALPRPSLPARFETSSQGRLTSLMLAALVVALGSFMIAWSFKGHGLEISIAFAAFGAGLLASSWFIGREGFTSVEMTEAGLVVRRPRSERSIAWSSIGRVELRSQVDSSKLPGRGSGVVVSAAIAVVKAVRERRRNNDPYVDPSLRASYIPAARMEDAGGRRLANFTEVLGWDFFLSLAAEAEARGIAITRKS